MHILIFWSASLLSTTYTKKIVQVTICPSGRSTASIFETMSDEWWASLSSRTCWKYLKVTLPSWGKIRSCLDRCKFRASSISRRSVLFLAGFLASAQTKYFLPTKAAPIGPWPCQVHLEWSLHGIPRHAVASPKLLFRLCAGTCSQDGEEQTNAKNCSENQILTLNFKSWWKLSESQVFV